MYQNISLLVALLFGTLGLPHVLVRFYTNPDGQSARRTTLIVLGLLSVFYLFPTAYGLIGRVFAPQLAQSGQADALVLLLPGELVGGMAGDLLSALVVAGAFAAFLSTTSGLVVSLAGVISQDLFGGSVQGFRRAAVISAVVPLGIASMTGSLALAGSVGMVFAFTASTICPVLLLGIWWRGLTDAGAIAGMVTGAVLCGGAMVAGASAGCRRNAVLAGAARCLDGAGSVCRDGPGLPGNQGPRATDHHPAHDPAAHAGTAAGHRALTAGLYAFSRWRP